MERGRGKSIDEICGGKYTLTPIFYWKCGLKNESSCYFKYVFMFFFYYSILLGCIWTRFFIIPLFWKNIMDSLLVNSNPLSDLIVLMVVLNWFSTMRIKALKICKELLLLLRRCVQVDLLKSSTKVIKYLKLSWVGVW